MLHAVRDTFNTLLGTHHRVASGSLHSCLLLKREIFVRWRILFGCQCCFFARLALYFELILLVVSHVYLITPLNHFLIAQMLSTLTQARRLFIVLVASFHRVRSRGQHVARQIAASVCIISITALVHVNLLCWRTSTMHVCLWLGFVHATSLRTSISHVARTNCGSGTADIS